MNEEPRENRGTISLRLYVAGTSPPSALARRQLDELLAEIDGATYEVEVVDVLERPDLAEQARVLATPMLVRTGPGPQRSIIGDLRDARTVIKVLGLERTDEAGEAR